MSSRPVNSSRTGLRPTKAATQVSGSNDQGAALCEFAARSEPVAHGSLFGTWDRPIDNRGAGELPIVKMASFASVDTMDGASIDAVVQDQSK
jgi:hypothetical protein